MKAGIIGLTSSGKSTLMSAFTDGSGPAGKGRGFVSVPDDRLYELEKIYSPQKTTPCRIEIDDFPPIDTGIKKDKLKFSDETKTLDVQILCIGGYRCISPEDITGEISQLRFEFIINDLDIITKRLEKVEKELKKFPALRKEKEDDIKVLEKLRSFLEEEKFPPREAFDEKEKKLLRNYNFFTVRPSVYVINLSEEQYVSNRDNIEYRVREYFTSPGETPPFILVDALTESDIMNMDSRETEEFFKVFGIKEPAKNKIIRKVYNLLGLITFFTVGEDEVRAWNIHGGDTAVEAAGAIHSDLARGFIRAEVVPSCTLLELGSLISAKAKGKLRLEGKSYIVKDGDVVHILFNV